MGLGLLTCTHQQCPVASISGLHIGTRVQGKLDHFQLVGIDGKVGRCHPIAVGRLQLCLFVQQDACRGQMAMIEGQLGGGEGGG